MQPLMQTTGGAPVGSTDARTGWVNQGFSYLGSALDAWGQVEQIKAKKQASGQDQTQAKYMPEHENAAGIVREAPQTNQKTDDSVIDVFGIKMNKNILIATGAVVAGLAAFKVMR